MTISSVQETAGSVCGLRGRHADRPDAHTGFPASIQNAISKFERTRIGNAMTIVTTHRQRVWLPPVTSTATEQAFSPLLVPATLWKISLVGVESATRKLAIQVVAVEYDFPTKRRNILDSSYAKV